MERRRLSLWDVVVATAVVVVTTTKARDPTHSVTTWAPRKRASHGLLVHDQFDQGRFGQHTQTCCQLSQNDRTHFRSIGPRNTEREREREREREKKKKKKKKKKKR